MPKSEHLGMVRHRVAQALAALLAIALLSLPSGALGGVAQAQVAPVSGVVAVVTGTGDVHVSWAAIGDADDVKFYVIRSGTSARPRAYPDAPDVELNGPKDAVFEPAAERPSYVIEQADQPEGGAEWVQLKWVGPTNPNGVNNVGWTEEIPVTDGRPVDVAASLSGDELEVTWAANATTTALTGDLEKYVVVIQSEQPNSAHFVNVGETSPATLSLEAIDAATPARELGDGPYEVQVRAVYSDELKTHIDGPWTDVAAVSDLKSECLSSDNGGSAGNVFETITAGDPDSVGYPEDRIPLETQVWFFPTADSVGQNDNGARGRNLGHAHLLTCVPHSALDSPVMGEEVWLDLEIKVHLQGGRKLTGSTLSTADGDIEVRVDEIEIRGKSGGGDILIDRFNLLDEGAQYLRPAGDDTSCTAGTCVIYARVPVDLTWSPRTNVDKVKPGFVDNGVKELRIAAVHSIYDVDDDSDDPIAQMRSIMRVPFDLQSPELGGETSVNPQNTESSGWLIQDDPGAGGYATIGVTDFNGEPVPITPISKGDTPVVDLTLHVEADPCRASCIVDRMPVVRYWGFLNPGFHGDAICQPEVDCRQFKSGADTPNLRIPEPIAAPRLPGDPEDIPETSHQVQIDISDLEPGVNRLVLAIEQPMKNGYNGEGRNTVFFGNDVGGYTIEDDFQSTLIGLLILRFVVTE